MYHCICMYIERRFAILSDSFAILFTGRVREPHPWTGRSPPAALHGLQPG